jgi:regulatory protein
LLISGYFSTIGGKVIVQMSESQKQQCQATAVRLLGRREHSCRELHQKLQARDFDPHIIAEVVAELQADNLQSDERFAESYVRSKAGRGVGPVRLRQELREHQIDDATIHRYLQDQQWRQLAAEVRQKRFGPALPESFEERARQMRFLQYRGFDSEQINSAMKQE